MLLLQFKSLQTRPKKKTSGLTLQKGLVNIEKNIYILSLTWKESHGKNVFSGKYNFYNIIL